MNRVQGMVRSIDQWRNMAPAAVAAGSQAQVEYALADAKTDIEALWCKVEQLTAAIHSQSRQPTSSQADRDAGSDEHLPVATGSNSSEVA